MTDIRPDDRVGVRIHGHSVMRTVWKVTDTHVTVMVGGAATEVPISELTSIERVGCRVSPDHLPF